MENQMQMHYENEKKPDLEHIKNLKTQVARWSHGPGVSLYGLAFLDAYAKRSWEVFFALDKATKAESLTDIELDIHRCVPLLLKYFGVKK